MSWLALWAMLAFALLPTVSHALAHAQQQGALGDICRAPSAWQQAAAGQAGTDTQPGAMLGHLQHCPLCAGADHVPVLLSALLDLAGFDAAAPPSLPPPSLLPHDVAAAWLASRLHGPPSTA